MAFAETLAIFWSDFGDDAVIGGVSVRGILDQGYYEPLGGFVAGNQPTFTCATAEVLNIPQGTSVTVRGVAYKVRGIEPDGTGVTLLRLEEQ